MDTNSYAGCAPEIVMAKGAEVCGGPGNLAYVLQSLREALTVVTCIRK